jgi:hypoxanthine phosphoribosyltransferase
MSVGPVATEAERIRRDARLVLSAAEVDAVIVGLAARVAAELALRRPVVLPVMLGGAFTAFGLCRHFDFAYEIDYLHVSRYGESLAGGELVWRSRPRLALEGRSVLLVDDVLDRGLTLRAVIDELERLGPASLHTAVLVSKDVTDARSRPAPDFVGVNCPDVYLFGCGMDYKGYWRGLPALYAVKEA